MAHYPPYGSKYNPIEHRLFSHITRACQGMVFHSVAIAKQFMEQAKTCTGLKVTRGYFDRRLCHGKKCAVNLLENMRIIFDDYLPRWNYRAIPQWKLISGSYFLPDPEFFSRNLQLVDKVLRV